MYEIATQEDLFVEEIGRLTKCLKSLDPQDKEYSLILKSVKALESFKVEESKIRNEQERLRIEDQKVKIDEKIRELEADIKDKHHEEDLNQQSTEARMKKRYDRLKLCMEIAGLILPLVFCWTWMNKGLAFEETGVFTSTTFRGLFNKFTGLI